MRRISGANTIDLGSGRLGYRDRNLALGQPGTTVPAANLTDFQEEIARVVELAGLALDPDDREQLAAAIRRLGNGVRGGVTGGVVSLSADQMGFLFVSAATGNATVNLPSASAAGGSPMRLLVVRWDNVLANTAAVAASSGQTVMGLASITVPAMSAVQLVSDGVNQWTVAGGAGLVQAQSWTAAGSATVVVPGWARRARVRVWGGGGGGGSGFAGAAATGGSGGGYAEGVFPVTAGATVAVTVGAGGTAGSGGGNGGAGGSSSFGTLLSATGGSGGLGSTAGAAPQPGAGGGIGVGGVINVAGGTASAAFNFGGGFVASSGAGSFGTPSTGITQGGALAAGSPGGGGSGGANNFGGAAGATGAVIVEWLA